jgi:3,4-dihydroxy 2-butanone 4-phosphate synthase/GTP cyclohydrolase II
VLPTRYGEFRIAVYRVGRADTVALLRGRLDGAPLVRLHSSCVTGDAFGSLRCDCGEQLDAALSLIGRSGGVLLYLPQEGRGIGIANKVRAYALQDGGADTIEANELLGLEVDLRRYEQCAEILLDLGLGRVRLITNNPAKLEALERCGLEVVERVALRVAPHDGFARYLRTKKQRMGHLVEVA